MRCVTSSQLPTVKGPMMCQRLASSSRPALTSRPDCAVFVCSIYLPFVCRESPPSFHLVMTSQKSPNGTWASWLLSSRNHFGTVRETSLWWLISIHISYRDSTCDFPAVPLRVYVCVCVVCLPFRPSVWLSVSLFVRLSICPAEKGAKNARRFAPEFF